MKITNHGKEYKTLSDRVEVFTCDTCGCEFEVDEEEYYVDLSGADSYGKLLNGSISISKITKDYIVCSCPECHKIAKKIRERDNLSCSYSISTTNSNSEPSNK